MSGVLPQEKWGSRPLDAPQVPWDQVPRARVPTGLEDIPISLRRCAPRAVGAKEGDRNVRWSIGSSPSCHPRSTGASSSSFRHTMLLIPSSVSREEVKSRDDDLSFLESMPGAYPAQRSNMHRMNLKVDISDAHTTVLNSKDIISLRGFNQDAAVDEGQRQSSSSSPTPEAAAVSKVVQCGICLEDEPEDFAILVDPCHHAFCKWV